MAGSISVGARREVLADFQGIVQTDGYDDYGGVAKRDDIISVGCLAHARRKFDDCSVCQTACFGTSWCVMF
jgi:hypothetical protein